MSSQDLKLALEIAAKTTGREDLAALSKEVGNLGPVSDQVEQQTRELAAQLQRLSDQKAQITQFQQSRDALTQLEQATVLSRDKLEVLRKSQQAGAGDAQTLARQEQLLTSEVKQLESQLVRQAASHTRLHAGLKQSGLDTSNLAGEQNRLQREITQTATKTEQLARDLTGAKAGATGMAASIGGLTSRLVAMGATYLGVTRLWDGLKAMFASGDQAERLSVQLKAVMGSIEGGQEATAWIQQFAKNTPLQLDEVTQVFVRLKAFGLDPMDGAMQGIVDQAFKLGGSFEEVQGISLALGQAWAKQKLQGEEILQLVERGVPVWELLEKVTGRNTAELQKLSEKGALGRDVIKSLMEEIARQSAGAAADNMSLLSGLISNARDNLESFYRMVAGSGAMDWLKQQLAELNGQFARMAADGSLQQWAKRISDAIISVGEGIKGFIKICVEWSGALKLAAAAFLAFKFAQFISGVNQAAAALSTKLIPALLRAAATASGEATAGLGTMAGKAALVASRLNAISLAIGAVVAAGYGIGEIAKGVFDLTEGAAIKNRLAEQERQLNDQLLRQGAELMAQNAQYKDMQILTAVQVAALSEKEREAYNQRLAGLQQYLTGQLKQNAALEQAGLLTDEQKTKTQTALEAMRQGFADFTVGQQQAMAIASKTMADYEKEVADAAKRTKEQAAATLSKAFTDLGLDLDLIEGRVSDSFKGIQQGLNALVQNTDASGSAIAAYLSKAFDAAQNEAELDLVRQAIKQLHDQGRLSFTQLAGWQVELAKKTSVLKDKTLDLTGAVTNGGKAEAAAAEAAKAAIEKQLQSLEAKRAAIIRANEAGTLSEEEYQQQLSEVDTQISQLNVQLLELKGASETAAHGLTSVADAADGAGNAAQDASDKVKNAKDKMEGLHSSTVLAQGAAIQFANEWKTASDVASLSLAEIEEQMATAQAIYDSSLNWLYKSNDLSTQWWKPHVRDQLMAQENNLALLKQLKQVKEATAELEAADQPTERLLTSATKVLSTSRRLDEQTLSGLRSAIDAARQKMDALASSATSTLNSLKDQLDELSGNDLAIEQRSYLTQLAELQASLAQAQAQGNKEAIASYQEAIKLAEQLHTKKLANIKAEQQAAQQEAKQASQEAKPQTTTTSSQTKTFRIELGGKTATVSADASNEATLEAILTQLTNAGVSTL